MTTNVFDSKIEKLVKGISVLVEANKIARNAKSITVAAGATVVNSKGHVLMPIRWCTHMGRLIISVGKHWPW